MALDRQVSLFKIDTNAFLSENEQQVFNILLKWRRVFKKICKELKPPEKEKAQKEYWTEIGEKIENGSPLKKYEQAYYTSYKKIQELKKEWKAYILDSAKKTVEYNKTHDVKRIRHLNEKYLSYTDFSTGEKKVNLKNVISMFESTLTRSFGIQLNELTYDIFIVEIYYFDIAQDLIVNGFDYNGNHYVYFSSSAGQIRTKKAVFVREDKYERCKNKIMCGLTVEKINGKGGMNINKFLAYLALSNSATDLWEDVFGKAFDIDRTIVVDDFETLVDCVVDNINYETYEITPGVEMEIPIPHTDGCGMISADYSKKNFMVRLPFIKGLLGSFDFRRFIEVNNCSPVIKDIWGKEYDVIEDDIQVIFTKSQLKMWKYYDSWDEYKENFKRYGCEAGICNMEEDYISDAKINYQMLQTLYDATDEEIKELCKIPNQKIQRIGDTLANALEFYGVDLDNPVTTGKDWFQKSLYIYPELITDPAAISHLRDLKNSLLKKYRGAHLNVKGKFTFVLPDLYAFCEWLFMDVKTPKGLLENGEVFCKLYKNYEELDCLRSPHLYIEHAVRKNVCKKKYRLQYLKDWFKTDAIYTSTHDPISRILQFDVDGDRLLVIAQKQVIAMSKRVMEGVYPLYYEMKKAKAELITPYSVYEGLRLAFVGGNIGGISNDITKIWNSGEITEEAKKAVKWLCMETNFTIDFAKTLYKPLRPQKVDTILKKYSAQKVPYFFYYAKNKDLNQVEPINNSTINRITAEIKDSEKRFKVMKGLKKVDYHLLLKNGTEEYSSEEVNKIFDRWNRQYGHQVNMNSEDNNKRNNLLEIANEVRNEISEVELDVDKVIASLVLFLYKKPSQRKKNLLWCVYGEELYNNLVKNVDQKNICRVCGRRTSEKLVRGKCYKCQGKEKNKGFKVICCADCGKEFIVPISNKRTHRCKECQSNFNREASRLWMNRNKKI